MKKALILTLALLLTLTCLCACDTGTGSSSSAPASSAASDAPASSAASSVASHTDAPATEAPTEVNIGVMSDYIKTAKEATQSFEDGSVKTFALPQILIDSSDAEAANKEIMDRFGEYCRTYDDHSPVIYLDYEASLVDRYLSVTVSGKFDGGNSYGLCYCFDVISGSRLTSKELCQNTGRDYEKALEMLKTNLTAQYDAQFSSLPGNDTERAKTFDRSNLEAAGMYLDGSGILMAMTDAYAAVGGGHWVYFVNAE